MTNTKNALLQENKSLHYLLNDTLHFSDLLWYLKENGFSLNDIKLPIRLLSG